MALLPTGTKATKACTGAMGESHPPYLGTRRAAKMHGRVRDRAGRGTGASSGEPTDGLDDLAGGPADIEHEEEATDHQQHRRGAFLGDLARSGMPVQRQ